tara:strand:+ start:229 stop:471 length:243 start_codon:yes stop_codon:yes gene_type:complete
VGEEDQTDLVPQIDKGLSEVGWQIALFKVKIVLEVEPEAACQCGLDLQIEAEGKIGLELLQGGQAAAKIVLIIVQVFHLG